MHLVHLAAAMRILIFSNYKDEATSSGRLYRAALDGGHQAALVASIEEAEKVRADWGGADIFIPRLSRRLYQQATEAAAYFESEGLLVSIGAQGIRDSHNKFLSYQKFVAAHVATPETWHIASEADLKTFEGSYPLIIKPVDENQGTGVAVVKSYDDLLRAGTELLVNYGEFIVQEFIEESVGRDKRAFVVGDKVVAAMERVGQPGVIVSNLNKGGLAKQVNLSDEEIALAIAANHCFDAVYSGIDIIESHRGPLVLEVNASPGFKIESITGIQVADKVIESLVQRKTLYD